MLPRIMICGLQTQASHNQRPRQQLGLGPRHPPVRPVQGHGEQKVRM